VFTRVFKALLGIIASNLWPLPASGLALLGFIASNPASAISAGGKTPEVIPVSLLTSRAIYCLGLVADSVVTTLEARCYHLWTGRAYRVTMKGWGPALQLEVVAFRLSVTYGAQNFDVVGAGHLDPIPGHYGLTTLGAGLLIGLSGFTEGKSAWPPVKTVSGVGINLGIGLDLGSISHVSIEPQ
jgi:hypothetical protein